MFTNAKHVCYEHMIWIKRSSFNYKVRPNDSHNRLVYRSYVASQVSLDIVP